MDIEEPNFIISLLKDDEFKGELKAFRLSYQRMRTRLRNNILIGETKQLVTQVKRLQADYPIELFARLNESKNPKFVRKFQSFNAQFISNIDKILSTATKVYCKTQPHFKVGHLVQHFIVLRSSIARIIICFKALLTYAIDLHIVLKRDKLISKLELKEKSPITHQEALELLKKHECKPRADLEQELVSINSDTENKESGKEEIGLLIDRTTMRPVRACKLKK